jgi:hypothetical protein
VLEDEHWVWIVQRGNEHAASVLDRRRCEHLDPGDVCVPAFEAVRVLCGELSAGTGCHPNHDRDVELAA